MKHILSMLIAIAVSLGSFFGVSATCDPTKNPQGCPGGDNNNGLHLGQVGQTVDPETTITNPSGHTLPDNAVASGLAGMQSLGIIKPSAELTVTNTVQETGSTSGDTSTAAVLPTVSKTTNTVSADTGKGSDNHLRCSALGSVNQDISRDEFIDMLLQLSATGNSRNLNNRFVRVYLPTQKDPTVWTNSNLNLNLTGWGWLNHVDKWLASYKANQLRMYTEVSC